VPYNVVDFDTCCSNVSLTYTPPVNTCFPLNSATPVLIVATDACGNSATGLITVTVLPAAGCGGSTPGPSITGKGGPGGTGTNYYAIWWNAMNAQLEASPNLTLWQPVPGGTNSPYVVPATSPASFFRLHYH
jgi:hypothetical protein